MNIEFTVTDSIWQVLIDGKAALFLVLPTALGRPLLYSSTAELLADHPHLTRLMVGENGNEGWMAQFRRQNIDQLIHYVVTPLSQQPGQLAGQQGVQQAARLVGLLQTDTMRNYARTFCCVLAANDINPDYIVPEVNFIYPETVWRRLKKFTDSFIAIDDRAQLDTLHISTRRLLTD